MWSTLRETITYALILNVLYFSRIFWKFWRSFWWLFTKLHQFIYDFVQSLLHFWLSMFTEMIKKILRWFENVSMRSILTIYYVIHFCENLVKSLICQKSKYRCIDLAIIINSSDDLIELDIWNSHSINNAKNRSRK